jgi:hypothetical protein
VQPVFPQFLTPPPCCLSQWIRSSSLLSGLQQIPSLVSGTLLETWWPTMATCCLTFVVTWCPAVATCCLTMACIHWQTLGGHVSLIQSLLVKTERILPCLIILSLHCSIGSVGIPRNFYGVSMHPCLCCCLSNKRDSGQAS